MPLVSITLAVYNLFQVLDVTTSTVNVLPVNPDAVTVPPDKILLVALMPRNIKLFANILSVTYKLPPVMNRLPVIVALLNAAITLAFVKYKLPAVSITLAVVKNGCTVAFTLAYVKYRLLEDSSISAVYTT